MPKCLRPRTTRSTRHTGGTSRHDSLALAKAAGVASIDNGTEPDPANLSEPETAEMETYLDYALPLFRWWA